jgi:DNA modification methylase
MIKEVQIKCKGSMTLELEQLEPFQGNLKDLSKENYNKLRKQIIELGFSEPICVWKNEGKYNILNGHQRVRVLTEMKKAEGWKVPRLPVVEVEAATEFEAKKKVLSLTSQYGALSNESLFEFASLNNIDLPTLEDFRFPEIDLDKFKAEFFDEPVEGLTDEDSVPEEVPAKSKIGDLYLLGEHRLLCGDSTDIKSVERLMNGEKADMVFTDPPYNMETTGRGAFSKAANALNKQLKGLVDFNPEEFLNVLPSVFNSNMSSFIFCNKDLIPNYLNWAIDMGFNFNILTWHKKSHVPFTSGSHYPDTEYVIFINKKAIFNAGLSPEHYRKYWITEKTEKEFGHPTQKPIEPIQMQIETWSNDKGIVCDLFGGSGSTLIACEKTKRKCFMSELDPKYCDIIISRWEKFTGKTAILDTSEAPAP